MKDECTLEAIIQLPPEYPLRNVGVSCTKRMGVSESRCALLTGLTDNLAVKGALLTHRTIIRTYAHIIHVGIGIQSGPKVATLAGISFYLYFR